MAKAPVLKTGGRKPLEVRILCPPRSPATTWRIAGIGVRRLRSPIVPRLSPGARGPAAPLTGSVRTTCPSAWHRLRNGGACERVPPGAIRTFAGVLPVPCSACDPAVFRFGGSSQSSAGQHDLRLCPPTVPYVHRRLGRAARSIFRTRALLFRRCLRRKRQSYVTGFGVS